MEASRLVRLLAVELATGPRVNALSGGLRSMVIDGRLAPGARLPPERILAQTLGVSRSTVTAAYDQLRGEGYLRSRRGSGTFADIPPAARGSRPDDDPGEGPSSMIDLSVAALPAPRVLGEAAAAAGAVSLGGYLAGNGLSPAGLGELRSVIAERYSQRGLPTRACEVLITSGALHAWDLMLRSFAQPGATVVVEEPTYPAVIDAALAHRTRLRPLPVDSEGWHPEELPAGRPAVLAHLTPDGHNPTGCWADDATRRALLAALDPSTVVVADETMVDFPHSALRATALPALAASGATVVAIGSASKSIWAGLRVGWIRGPEPLIRRVTVARAGQDLAPPILEQLIAADLMARHDELLAERRPIVAERRQALLRSIQRHCPDWSVTPPASGLGAWVDLGGASSTRLASYARDHGIRLTPGPRFSLRGTHDRWIRLPFVLPPDQLDDALERLSHADRDLPPARRQRHPTAENAWTA